MSKFKTIKPYQILKPNRWVKKVFIHCSAARRANIDAEEIDLWHKQRGWSGIGYHYFIKTDGTLELGRNIERVPAAQRYHNRGSIAICLNGLKLEDFTVAQKATLKEFCKNMNKLYNGKLTFHGHCEVANKACPVIHYKKLLNLDSKGRLGI